MTHLLPFVLQVLTCALGDTLVYNRAGTGALCVPKTVAVVVPAPVPPSVSHEPSGMLSIRDDDMTAGWLQGCPQPSGPSCPRPAGLAYNAGYAGAFSFHTDQTAPRSPVNILRQNFTPQLSGGASPGTYDISFAGKMSVYVSWWQRISTNFVGHGTSTNKDIHFFIGGGNRIYVMLRGSGMNPLVPAFGLQGMATAYSCGGQTSTSVNCLANVSMNPVTRGAWEHWEVVLNANTSGQANGSMMLWMNDTLRVSYSGLTFTSNGAPFTNVAWSPTWGGGGGAITSAFTMDFDHLYISGR